MIFSKKLLPSIALATSMGLGMAASPTIHAETATATLEVTAGLRAAMSLECNTALDFGWTTLNTAAAVTLTVDPTGAVSVPDSAGVTVGTAVAGECTVSGADTATVSIVIDGATTMTAGKVGNLALPTTALALAFTAVPEAPSIAVTAGSATFKIGGTLTIPAAIVSADLGGYIAQSTVTVSDAI
jgi:hypothetical protein